MYLRVAAGSLSELKFKSLKTRKDPWSETSIDVHVAGNGSSWKIPAFWAGRQEWRARFTPPRKGTYSFRTVCEDASDKGLHGIEGVIEARSATSHSSVFTRHGAVNVSAKGNGFEHEDGTPFFWLADTWWMIMSERISWPEGFKRLTADRVKKGFTVVQTVIGFQPDTAPFDGRDSNKGGSPWEKGYARINPRYFDEVDLRIEWLVKQGILPCILGSWGYHLLFMGEDRMRLHWKYLVARYGAYPVAWCLAGETAMPYYLSKDGKRDSMLQMEAWTRIGIFVKEADPFHRPLTTHPRRKSWEDLEDTSILDFHMLQVGHTAACSCESSSKFTEESRKSFPNLPVVNGEPPYEGHMGLNGPEVQRYAFWATILSGGAGFTYGAAGIFQANDRKRPTGDRPAGKAFDGIFWDDAMHLPGSSQLGLARKLLSEFPFLRLEPHPEWIEIGIKWGAEHYHPPFRSFCVGIPRECRIAYIPARFYHWDGPLVKNIEPGVKYRAWYWNTVNGEKTDLGKVKPDGNRCWQAPLLPFLHDWILVLERSR